MPKYVTKQRMALLEYLSKHPDEQLSARDIAASLEPESVSVSAVYRNLNELESDGSVRRVTRHGSREVLYQYLDAAPCREQLHMSCQKCGRTYHMDPAGAERLIRTLEQLEHFQLDRSATVLYGLCRYCQEVRL